jgi:hypothetical protein
LIVNIRIKTWGNDLYGLNKNKKRGGYQAIKAKISLLLICLNLKSNFLEINMVSQQETS